MSELIRCAECEGWGITSYEKDGSPNKCGRCNGAGKVEKPPEPVYVASDPTADPWWLTTTYGKLTTEAMSKIPCGKTLGHGYGCGGGYGLCQQCKTIKALCEAAAEAYSEGFANGRGDY